MEPDPPEEWDEADRQRITLAGAYAAGVPFVLSLIAIIVLGTTGIDVGGRVGFGVLFGACLVLAVASAILSTRYLRARSRR